MFAPSRQATTPSGALEFSVTVGLIRKRRRSKARGTPKRAWGARSAGEQQAAQKLRWPLLSVLVCSKLGPRRRPEHYARTMRMSRLFQLVPGLGKKTPWPQNSCVHSAPEPSACTRQPAEHTSFNPPYGALPRVNPQCHAGASASLCLFFFLFLCGWDTPPQALCLPLKSMQVPYSSVHHEPGARVRV